MGDRFFNFIGERIVRYLEQPSPGYEPSIHSDIGALKRTLRRGDVLLVEGNTRVAAVIKYLTQSTWSHAALYVGNVLGKTTDTGEPHVLIEALAGEGIISAPLSKYAMFHTRICRPVGLTPRDRIFVSRYLIDRLGYEYDLKNIVDLVRYLVPIPVPQRWRRRMIALGSGSPTRAICSTVIAQAFEAVRYPILPKIELVEGREARREILHIRHFSLYTPRDFDISPYFAVVKPTIEIGFNYRKLRWADRPLPPPEERETAPRPLAGGGGRVPLAASACASSEREAVGR